MSVYELNLLASASATRRMDGPRRLSIWLPLFSVVVWVKLVAWPILYYFVSLMSSKRSGLGAHPVSYLFLMAFHYGTSEYAHVIEALTLPGTFLEVLISLPTVWPNSWHPADVPLEDWRALTWPFFSMPFWWFAGVGIEGWLRIRSLRWPSLLAGTILCGFFVVLFFGLSFGMSREERLGTNDWVFWGLALWIILPAAFPAVWIRNWRTTAAAA